MQKSKKDEWNFFFRRILQKDIRCGLSEKTVNKLNTEVAMIATVKGLRQALNSFKTISTINNSII